MTADPEDGEPTPAIGMIADFLVDQRDEPWPSGTESDRLHYWRDKAITAATHLRAMVAASPPDQGRVDQRTAQLAIAARRVAFEGAGVAALKALDVASEAFASDVPWDDAPCPE